MLAVHDVVFVDDQVISVDALYATFAGLALRLSIGAGAACTAIVTVELLLPPAPLQLNVYEPDVVKDTSVVVPAVGLLPVHAPLAVHAVALVDDHVKVELARYATDAGSADKVMTGVTGVTGGADTDTDADATTVPPAPVHVKVYVAFAVSASVVCVPLALNDPDQAPLPIH